MHVIYDDQKQVSGGSGTGVGVGLTPQAHEGSFWSDWGWWIHGFICLSKLSKLHLKGVHFIACKLYLKVDFERKKESVSGIVLLPKAI